MVKDPKNNKKNIGLDAYSLLLNKSYREVIEFTQDFIFIVNKQGLVEYVNKFAANSLSLAPGRIIGKSLKDLFPPQTYKHQISNIRKIFESGVPSSFENIVSLKGKNVWLDTRLAPITGPDGKIKSVIGISRNTTERKAVEEAFKDNQRMLYTLMSNLPGMVYRCRNDKKYTMSFCSQGCINLTGYEPNDFLNNNKISYSDIIHPEDRLFVWNQIQKSLKEKKPFRLNYRINTANGQEKWVWEQGRGVFSPEGEFVTLEGFITDTTERNKAEVKFALLNNELLKANKRLKQLVLRDSHTGLYNHRYLNEVMESEFARSKRYKTPFSVIMLDIDYFKSINDVYGHQFGDLILKQFARQLKKSVRRYDTVVRFGGEEFIVISPGLERDKSTILAQRLLDTVNLYTFGNRRHSVKLKISVAVASYPENKVSKASNLITFADHILGKAKEHGGNVVFSSIDMKKKRLPDLRTSKESRNDIDYLREKLEKLTRRANQSLIEAIFAFAKTIELKDHYTGEHVERTVRYATEVARELKLSGEEVEKIKQAAILHDLGKIGISEKILLKKFKLTGEEYNKLKKHPQIGVDIIRPIHFLNDIIPLILYHHERWDGKGYPDGLHGKNIPLGARIIAIADVYQALISDRPYRKAYPKDDVLKIIKSGSGTQFDPAVVRALLKILKRDKN